MFSQIQLKRSIVGGFSLIEVILALGIFLITVLAMVGLLGPTLNSVDEVEKTDEVVSVVNTVNAFLQSSPDIGTTSPPVTRLQAIYDAIADDGFATIFVFRQFYDETTGLPDPDSTAVRMQIGFDPEDDTINVEGQIDDFSNAAGPIFRVVLTPSSVIPETGVDLTDPPETIPYRSAARDALTDVYSLSATFEQYAEGYFAMEARVYDEQPPAPGAVFEKDVTLQELAEREPIFTYNTAVLR